MLRKSLSIQDETEILTERQKRNRALTVKALKLAHASGKRAGVSAAKVRGQR